MKYLEGENYYDYLKEQALKKANAEKIVSPVTTVQSPEQLEVLEQELHNDQDIS
jgi:hypothetical protein